MIPEGPSLVNAHSFQVHSIYKSVELRGRFCCSPPSGDHFKDSHESSHPCFMFRCSSLWCLTLDFKLQDVSCQYFIFLLIPTRSAFPLDMFKIPSFLWALSETTYELSRPCSCVGRLRGIITKGLSRFFVMQNANLIEFNSDVLALEVQSSSLRHPQALLNLIPRS